MIDGISIREFACRAGCDDKVVRRKVKTEHIQLLADGTIDPAYLNVDWRNGEAPSADTDDLSADTSALVDEAIRLVSADGTELWSKADAEKVKENYAARLKQLEYDRSVGEIAPIADVAATISGEFALVRGKLLNLGSRIAPRVVALEDAAAIKAAIDAEVVMILNELTADVPGAASMEEFHDAVRRRFAPDAPPKRPVRADVEEVMAAAGL